MKKLAGLIITVSLLSSCADMSARSQEQYRDISKCEIPSSNEQAAKLDKESFANLLTSEAAISSLEGFSEKNKIDTLQIIGWNQSVAQNVDDCYRQKKIDRLDRVTGEFKKIKELTKNADEKKALISAFSAWESYIKNPTPGSERDFEQKSAYYKNM